MRLCLLIALGMSSLAAYNVIPWGSLKPSDWGTWVGAIGTVATLAGTIWLATNDRRLRKRAERDMALLAVSGLMWRIQTVEEGLAAIMYDLKLNLDGIKDIDYSALIAKFDDLPLWTPSDLIALVSIDGHVAARLAFSGDSVGSIKQYFVKEILQRGIVRNELGRRQFNKIACNRLLPVIDHIGDAKDDCLLFWNSCRLNESFLRGRRTASRASPVAPE